MKLFLRGSLVLKMGQGEVRWQKPVVYQEKNGTRQEITAHYVLLGTNRVYMVVQAKPLYYNELRCPVVCSNTRTRLTERQWNVASCLYIDECNLEK